MPTTEPTQGGPYPLPEDPPDGPNQLAALTVWAAGRIVGRYTSLNALNAAVPSPVEGMVAVIGSGASQRVLVRNAESGWVPVVPGRLLRSASSTLGVSSSAAWVTQPGHAAEFTVPGAGLRMVEMSLSALLNAGVAGMVVGARVAVDGISILETRGALTIAGSAGRFQQGVADSAELVGGVHSIAVQVSRLGGAAGEATLVWSVVNVWDRGAAQTA